MTRAPEQNLICSTKEEQRTEAYHLGESLLALGVLLAEQMLLPGTPPHNLAPPRHPESLRRRLRDTHTQSTKPIQRKFPEDPESRPAGTEKEIERVSKEGTLWVFILYPFFPAATTANEVEVVPGLRGSGDATEAAVAASGAPKKDLGGKARVVEGSLLAPALAETAARGAARARERDSAIASLSLPLCGFRSDRLRTDGEDRDSSEPLSAGFALRGPFAKWSAHNLRTGDPSGQAGPRIFYI